MPALVEVRDTTSIQAPLDRVWALSTRVELVRETLGMTLTEGPDRTSSGFIRGGSRVVWKGWKFGLPTEHHTLITGFEPPHEAASGKNTTLRREAWFQDSQEHGRFAFFQHDHAFRELRSEAGTTATLLGDHVRFALPWMTGGSLAAAVLMRPYVVALVRRRFQVIKELAEGEGWRQWV